MDKLRLAIIGYGQRGTSQTRMIKHFPDVVITAVCDAYEDRCLALAGVVEEAGMPAPFRSVDYREIINRDDVDIVMIYTSWESHIEIAIEAMKAKKIVGLEVGGAYTVEECWKLVDTYEETKSPIMFLENCCYGRNELLVRNMVQDGLFGEIVHCHGGYCHDLRKEVTEGAEKRHYRLKNYINRNCENYPTHELGPIAKILDINRGNAMKRLVSVASKSAGLKQYVNDRRDTIENKSLIGLEFKQGDMITCENGETISLTLDTTLPRSYSREFTVRGTKGMYEENTNSVFLDGEEESFDTIGFYKKTIDNAKNYEEKYLPDMWKNITKEQLENGHGGMDYFLFRAFIDAVRNHEPMPIDVYDAAAWMCITPLSEYSIKNENASVEIPDFTRGKWKERERLNV